MPSHQIFNERPESQDRALRELQAMGYQYIPRAEAEQKRGHLSHVLFPDVMREFLASQSFIYRGKQTPFPDDAIGEAIRELDAPLERGLMFSSNATQNRLRHTQHYVIFVIVRYSAKEKDLMREDGGTLVHRDC